MLRMFKTLTATTATLFLLLLSSVPESCTAAPLTDDLRWSGLHKSQKNLESCETVASIIGSTFFMNIGQLERGASEHLLLQSYKVALGNLLEFVRQNHSDASQFGDVCLTEAERSYGVYQNETSDNMNSTIEELDVTPEAVSRIGIKDYPQYLLMRSISLHPNISSLSGNISNFALPEGFDDVINSSSVAFQEEVYQHMGVHSAVDHVAELVPLKDSINLFYFPIYLLSDGDIPALDGQRRTNVLDLWNNIVVEMQKDPAAVSIDNISILPPTVEIFFDPFEKDVQDNFTRFSLPNSQFSGDQLLYSTSAIMFRAALAGVDEGKCLSILNHTAAFLFNAMRSSRVEGRSIQISPTFLPVYDEAFRRWTAGMDLSNAPIVEPFMVEAIYRNDLEPLLYFNASGNLDYVISTDGGTWAPTDLTEKLFQVDKLESLRQMAFNNLSEWRTVRTSPDLRGKDRSGDMAVSVRDDECPFGYVLFINPAVQPQTPEEECCAAVCEDLELILEVGLTTMSECCALCNLDTCYVGNVDPLNGLTSITIAQYGLLEEKVISVTI